MVDILSFIPDELKQKLGQEIIDFIADQAKKVANEQIAGKIRKLSSKTEFAEAVDKAIQKGGERFMVEYLVQDEDLSLALTGDPDFWKTPSVQKALLALVKQPGAWLPNEYDQVAAHFAAAASFADVLPGRINRQRVDRAVTYFLRCVVEELWTLPGAKEIREVYALQFQKISAEAAREQVALAQKQLEATQQLSVEMRQALAQLTEAMERKMLEAPALAALPAPRPYHNLPRPDYSRFVGRDKEMEWLRRRLSPEDRAWQIAITGIGGVGKSALALAIAHEYQEGYAKLPEADRFDAIIWISAKEEVLTAQGREKAALPEAILRTLEDVYTAIAHALDREDITRAIPEEQAHVVENALKEQRTLLIMDNLESVKDERIKPFLRNLPAPTKVIITSREWLDVADVFSLKGMSLEDAVDFMSAYAQDRQVILNAQQKTRLHDLTAGLPLPLKLSIARMAGGESFASVERWLGDAQSDLPEYCIAGQVELARQRDPNTWNMLLACSLFERDCGASLEALGYVANLSIVDRDHSLAELQKLFLVNRTEIDRFWVLPIVQRYERSQILSFGIEREKIISRWIEWLLNFKSNKGTGISTKIELMREFGYEYPNFLLAIRWCQQSGRWEDIEQLAIDTWDYADITGLHNELNEIIEAVIDAAGHTSNIQMLERAYVQLGRLSVFRGQYDQALEYFELAEKYISQPNDDYIGEIWYQKSFLYGEKDDIEESQKYAEKLYTKGVESKNLRSMLLGAYRYSVLEADKGNYRSVHKWLERMKNWAIQLEDSRTQAMIEYRRGMTYLTQNQYPQAEISLKQALEMNISWGEHRFIGIDMYRLATLYAKTGDLDAARRYAEDALAIFERLGMEIFISKTNALLSQIIGNPKHSINFHL